MFDDYYHPSGTLPVSRLRWLLPACFALLAHPVWAANLTVLAAEPTELADEFTAALQQLRPDDQIVFRTLGERLSDRTPDAVVTLGWRAFQWQQQHLARTPTVAAYLGLEQIQHYQPDSPADSLHILLVSPKPSRQVALARLLMPRMMTLGLLYDDSSRLQLPAWQQSADAAGLGLSAQNIDDQDDLIRSLTEVLSRSDVLMALDDKTIFHADNLRSLLLTSYARDKVMIGPSAPYIAAGSLSTTFSSPGDTAHSVSKILTEGIPAGMSYPRHFSVISNPHLARSLGFPTPDDTALAQALMHMETAR